MSESTAFRKYKNINSQNNINYEIIETKLYLEHIKLGIQVYKNTTHYPDYFYYLARENICNYIDSKNVKEVWIWTHQDSILAPKENYLIMGNNIKNYWNYVDFGTVGSPENKEFIPICNNSYTLYNYNLTRDVAKMQENHLHQMERLGEYVDFILFKNKFTGVNTGETKPSNPGCGWAHYPPNGTVDYDHYNTKDVLSDCEDWKPDRSGLYTLINCTRWSKLSTCPFDGGKSYYVWWMQSIPGYNNGLKDGDKELRNWWDFVENFDKAIQQDTKFYKWKYGDFNKDGADNSLDSAFFLKSLFNNSTKIFFDLDDSNAVNLNDLVLQLNSL